MPRKPRSKINQKELAKQLGVSQMTISRVLNNRPGVSEELQEKIIKAVSSTDYVHDHVAAGLRTQSTRVIGLIIPDVSHSFFPDITKAIERRASEEGYSVILAHSYESYVQECKQVNLLLGFRVCGFIIAPAGRPNEVDIYDKLVRLKVPFVFIDRNKKKAEASYVISDTCGGAASIGDYLISKGYKRWGYLAGPKGISSSDEHLRGLKASLKKAGIGEERMVSVRAGFGQEDGYEATKKLWARVKPDVIVAVNDPVAIGAYYFLKEKGVKVPQEVGLVGFSDLKQSDILEVPLTTVREKTLEIGQKAVEALFVEMSQSGSARQEIRVGTELVVREST